MVSKKFIKTTFLFLIQAIIYVSAGTGITLFLKIQGEVLTKLGTLPTTNFRHPFFQVLESKSGFSLAGIFIIIAKVIQVFKFWGKPNTNQRIITHEEGELKDLKILEEKSDEKIISQKKEISQERDNEVNNTKSRNIKSLTKDSQPSIINQEFPRKIITPRKPSKLYYILPSMVNMCGNLFSFFGLFLTYASYHQMISSSITIFTSILSVIIFKRKIHVFRWIGIFIVLIGTIIIGISTSLNTTNSSTNSSSMDIIIGNILAFIGVIFISFQFVCEEYVYLKYDDVTPTEVVCWSGLWGIGAISGVLLITYFLFPQLDDSTTVLIEITTAPIILIFIVGVMISICLYNVFGNLITKSTSASARCIIDCLRIITVSVIQIARKKEQFDWLRFFGGSFVLLGNFVYFELIPLRLMFMFVWRQQWMFPLYVYECTDIVIKQNKDIKKDKEKKVLDKEKDEMGSMIKIDSWKTKKIFVLEEWIDFRKIKIFSRIKRNNFVGYKIVVDNSEEGEENFFEYRFGIKKCKKDEFEENFMKMVLNIWGELENDDKKE